MNPLHPSVQSQFVREVPSARHRFFPSNLDVKQTEIARNLLVNNRDSVFTSDSSNAIPIFLSTDESLESDFVQAKPPLCVILDLHDKGRKFDFLGITDLMWNAIELHNLRVLYFKLQVHDPKAYAPLNKAPANVTILAMPLLPGGSRFHVTVQPDFDGDALFSRTLNPNPNPTYEYDWSWVGATTSDDRKEAFEILRDFNQLKRFYTVSQPGHADASVATVPHNEYLRISRASKICLSLNGRGPWCLKDGELFSQECFILRQDHPSLTLHPLSPQDGVHWALATTKELPGALEFLSRETETRERMRHAGHQWFKQVLEGNLWSNEHIRRLDGYLKSGSKSAWDGIAIA